MVAQNALTLADLKVEGEADAIVIDLTDDVDKPGTLGRMTKKLSGAGVNISAAYLATNNRAVLVTADNDKARAALGIE